jgi:glycosyltransferase involved in cell wall biosynthesis
MDLDHDLPAQESLTMRIAFVTQRYGIEVVGGAETLARQLAERLTRHFTVEAITTCALEYTTWTNHYPQGETILNGVRVQRFRTDQPRHPQFDRIYAELENNPQRTILDEIEWMKAQGPYSADLLCFLRSAADDYDLLLFVGYLYFQTYFGLQVAPQRAILIPTTHDEPPLYYNIFNTVFGLPQGLVFLSREEQQLAQRRFHLPATLPQAIIGGGITLPGQVDVNGFRQKYGLDVPYLLYAGRIDPSKQCDVLFQWFVRYRQEQKANVKLLCSGRLDMPLPEGKDIYYLGMLSEEEKFAAMAGASVFVMPSQWESFSIASLEAWGVSTPVLANAASAVVRGHCQRSSGGLYYNSYQEFAGCLNLLLTHPAVRDRLGRNGQNYVRSNYDWDVVEKRYADFVRAVASTLP